MVMMIWLSSAWIHIGLWVRSRTQFAITAGRIEISEHEDHIYDKARRDESRSWNIYPTEVSFGWWFQRRGWGYGNASAYPLWPVPLILGLITGILWIRTKGNRRGLCPRCAYDLAGLTLCPECGLTPSPPGRGQGEGS